MAYTNVRVQRILGLPPFDAHMAAKSTQNYRFLATFLPVFYRFSKMDFLKVLVRNASNPQRLLFDKAECLFFGLHAHDGEFLVDFIMLEDPCGG